MKTLGRVISGSVVAGAFVAYVIYELIATAMYTHALVDFYEIEDYSLTQHGIAINGRTTGQFPANLITVTDLAVTIPDGGASVPELCSHVTSNRGHTTLSVVSDEPVCCWAEANQYLVPFRQVDGRREYLCGSWPHLDHVSQDLSTVRYPLDEKLKNRPG